MHQLEVLTNKQHVLMLLECQMGHGSHVLLGTLGPLVC